MSTSTDPSAEAPEEAPVMLGKVIRLEARFCGLCGERTWFVRKLASLRDGPVLLPYACEACGSSR